MTDAATQAMSAATAHPPHVTPIPPYDILVNWLRDRLATQPDPTSRRTRQNLHAICIRAIGLGIDTPAETRAAMRAAGWTPPPALNRLAALWPDSQRHVDKQLALSSPAGRRASAESLWRKVVGRVLGSAGDRTMMALTPAERALVLRALVVTASQAARRITSDERNPGGAVPVTVGWLADQLGVTHVTARRVLGLLSDGGKTKSAAIAVTAGSAGHTEIEQLRAGGRGERETAAGKKAAKLLAVGYVVAQVTEKDDQVRYSLRLTVPGLRWLRHISTHPESGVRTWRLARLSGDAVAAADARAEIIAALADGESSRHPVADALTTASLPIWGHGELPDGRPLPASAWITAVVDADGTLPSDTAKRALGVGSSREVRAVRAWLASVSGTGRLSSDLIAEQHRQDISEKVTAARAAGFAAAAARETARQEVLAQRAAVKAERKDAAYTLAQAAAITQTAALRAAGAPASTRRGITGHLWANASLNDALAWLVDVRAGLPAAIRRRTDKGHSPSTPEALSWVVEREVAKRGGRDDLARAQADTVARAAGGRWTWGLEAQLWVAVHVGPGPATTDVQEWLGWRDRTIAALHQTGAVRPGLAAALGEHVAQRLAAAGAPPQVSERSAAAVREAGVAELLVPVF